jgi:hypothetical protein
MSATEFLTQLCQLTGQSHGVVRRPRPVHVLINNARYGHPSSAIIEFRGAPPLTLLVSNLQSPYFLRTLVLNRRIWPAGEESVLKRRLSELIDAFLESLGVERETVLAKPFRYVGK